jgi:membrane-associated protease RseP (regulator of RpoE activity)
MLRGLTVAAAVLALATGAVVAFASTDDDGPEIRQGVTQEGEPTPEPGAAAQAWLGVSVHPADEGGVVIKRAFEDGPAAQAGLERGDRITALDGSAIDSVEALREAISAKAPGDDVTLTIVREGAEDGATEEVAVTLGEKPQFEDIRGKIDEKISEYFDRFLGGSFRYLDDEGAEIETEIVPGTVTAISDTEITLDVNGDEGERTFSFPEDAGVSDGLESGDRAVVVLENGEVKGVKGGHFPFFPIGPGGFDMPFGPGFDGPFEHGRFPKICEGEGGIFHEYIPCKPDPELEITPGT